MRLGIITDIHNNLTALKAVIEKLQKMKCDKIICCGDIIGIGPCPEETVQYLMQISDLIAVRGNHDNYLVDKMPEEYPNEEQMSLEEMEHHKWEHRLLSESSKDFLQKMPYRIDMACKGYRLSIMHYGMNSDGHYINFRPNPSVLDLEKMFVAVNSDIIVYGHDHRRNICKSDKLYINVGSLGCPAQDKNLARAGVIHIEHDNIKVDPIDVIYDVNSVINMMDTLNYPEAANIKKYFYGK